MAYRSDVGWDKDPDDRTFRASPWSCAERRSLYRDRDEEGWEPNEGEVGEGKWRGRDGGYSADDTRPRKRQRIGQCEVPRARQTISTQGQLGAACTLLNITRSNALCVEVELTYSAPGILGFGGNFTDTRGCYILPHTMHQVQSMWTAVGEWGRQMRSDWGATPTVVFVGASEFGTAFSGAEGVHLRTKLSKEIPTVRWQASPKSGGGC